MSNNTPENAPKNVSSPLPASDMGKTWAAIGTFFGLVATCLLLLGLGVAIAIETDFRIPYASSFGSPTELIELAPLVLSNLLLVLTDPKFFWNALTTSIYPSLGVAAVVFVAWLLLGGFIKKQCDPRKEGAFQLSKWLLAKNGDVRLKPRLLEAAKFAIASSLVHPVMLGVCFIVMVASVITLSFIPMIGMVVGEQYFTQYVLEPTRCAGDPAPLEPSEKRALCVSISGKDQVTVTGRLVTATNTVAVIYHPQSNSLVRAERVSLENSNIQALTKLP